MTPISPRDPLQDTAQFCTTVPYDMARRRLSLLSDTLGPLWEIAWCKAVEQQARVVIDDFARWQRTITSAWTVTRHVLWSGLSHPEFATEKRARTAVARHFLDLSRWAGEHVASRRWADASRIGGIVTPLSPDAMDDLVQVASSFDNSRSHLSLLSKLVGIPSFRETLQTLQSPATRPPIPSEDPTLRPWTLLSPDTRLTDLPHLARQTLQWIRGESVLAGETSVETETPVGTFFVAFVSHGGPVPTEVRLRFEKPQGEMS